MIVNFMLIDGGILRKTLIISAIAVSVATLKKHLDGGSNTYIPIVPRNKKDFVRTEAAMRRLIIEMKTARRHDWRMRACSDVKRPSVRLSLRDQDG